MKNLCTSKLPDKTVTLLLFDLFFGLVWFEIWSIRIHQHSVVTFLKVVHTSDVTAICCGYTGSRWNVVKLHSFTVAEVN